MIVMCVAFAMPAVAENTAENTENNTTESVADIVLNEIDPVVASHFYFYDEEEQTFVVEYGRKFIRVRNIEDNKLVATLSINLHKEAGSWINGANNVVYNASEDRFYPAKKMFRKGKLIYQGAKMSQSTPLKTVREVEEVLGIVF